MSILKCLLLLAFLGCCFGANILILLPMPFRSHTFTFKPLFDELAKRGHNVTMLSPYSFPKGDNIKHIKVGPETDIHTERYIHQLSTRSRWFYMLSFWELGISGMAQILEDKAIKELRDDVDSKFDLVISEVYFMHEPLVGFGHKFSCPVINIAPISTEAWSSYLSGNPLPYSYVPSYKLIFTDKMSFFERLQNSLMYTIEFVGSLHYYLPIQEAKMREFFNSEMPPMLDMLKESPLTLVDGHFSIGYKRPYLPNVVECGGLSLKSGKPMTKEIQDIIDKSEKGIVYFSLGGHFDTSKLGKEKVEALLKAFGMLEYTVFMKFDLELSHYDNKPKNVITSNWLPQSSILGHPKCKLFVTHGGLHSLTEAAFHGVPVVGIPIFSDQKYNVKFIEAINMGLQLPLEELTAERTIKAITNVINNPMYKTEAMKRSKIVKDRPLDVLKTCTFWVEYVLNHDGAKHLRPAGSDLPLYQYYLLDVILFLLAFLTMLFYLIFKIVKLCVSCFLKKKEKQD